MDVVVHGRHIELSQQFRDHVEDKVSRLDRFGVPVSRIDVEVTQELNPRLADRAIDVELTCRGVGPVIRAEAASADKYAALEAAYDRLEERLRRAADRKRSAIRYGTPLSALQEVPIDLGGTTTVVDETDELEEVDDAVYVNGPIVVREKTHESAPMTVADAVDQMELVGHDFYLFTDSESGLPSVVYRRQSFDYGLIRLTAD